MNNFKTMLFSFRYLVNKERKKRLKQFNNKCWICGNTANSYEHKFKAALLKKHFGKKYGEANPHVYVYGGKQVDLKSYKSKELKFRKTICINCNNNLTKPHDDSFDIFCDYIRSNYEELITYKQINFENIYGKQWKAEKANLFKYYAKHAGCKVSTSNIQFDLDNIGDFIRVGSKCRLLKLHFVLNQGIKCLDDYFGGDFPNLQNGPTILYSNNGRNDLNFGGWTSNYWISCFWVIGESIEKRKLNDLSKRMEPLEIKYLADCKPFKSQMDFDALLKNIEYSGIENRIDQITYYKQLMK